MSTREIRVYKDLMGANEEWAAKTRDLLAGHRILMLNLIGSPGSGKTTLLEKVTAHLRDTAPFAVLEGTNEERKHRGIRRVPALTWSEDIEVTQTNCFQPVRMKKRGTVLFS